MNSNTRTRFKDFPLLLLNLIQKALFVMVAPMNVKLSPFLRTNSPLGILVIDVVNTIKLYHK